MKHQIRNSEFHLTPAELTKLIEGTTGTRDRLILELLVYTAIRRAELQMLRMEDVEFPLRRLLIRRGKGGKQRIVYLPDLVLSNLRTYCDSHTHEFLFPGRSGTPMSLRNINYIVSRVGEKAGIDTPNPRYKNVGPHLLRHSFARNWKRAGGSLESLQKILGHASLKTTLDVYGTESQLETEENYRRIVESLSLPR